jgi:hypothetical protein
LSGGFPPDFSEADNGETIAKGNGSEEMFGRRVAPLARRRTNPRLEVDPETDCGVQVKFGRRGQIEDGYDLEEYPQRRRDKKIFNAQREPDSHHGVRFLVFMKQGPHAHAIIKWESSLGDPEEPEIMEKIIDMEVKRIILAE